MDRDLENAVEEVRERVDKARGSILGRIVIWLLGIVLVGLVCLGLYRMLFLYDIKNYELAYTFDRLNDGKIEAQYGPDGKPRSGYVRGFPFILLVNTIDLRPMQVCIGANARVLNCKLVQFDPAGLELFLLWHGRDDYEGPAGGGSTTTTQSTKFGEILKSYAYEGGGKRYPFLKIIRELGPQEVGAQ